MRMAKWAAPGIRTNSANIRHQFLETEMPGFEAIQTDFDTERML
jgi:hypothetical protein